MARSMFRMAFTVVLYGTLFACGGGGSDTPDTPTPEPPSPYGVERVFEPQTWRGYFRVGTTLFKWQDPARDETKTSDIGDLREVHARLFYPTDDQYSDNRLKVIPPDFWLRLGGEEAIAGKKLRRANYLNVKWDVEIDAALSSAHVSYPLIIFSNGYGLSAENHANICAELASKGYIVASLYHPFGTGVTELLDGTTVYSQSLPDNNLGVDLGLWSDDQIFALDQLQMLSMSSESMLSGRLDDRIGVMGHSYGGAAAYYSAWKDVRFRAAVNLDGTIFNSEDKGISQPFMYLQNNSGYDLDIFEQVNNSGYAVLFNGEIEHLSFADHVLFWAWDFPDQKPFGPMDSKLALEFTADISYEFFELTFSASDAPLLNGITPAPENIVISVY